MFFDSWGEAEWLYMSILNPTDEFDEDEDASFEIMEFPIVCLEVSGSL